MKNVRISTDCSCYGENIDAIKHIIRTQIKPLLRYHYKVLEISTDGTFVWVDVDIATEANNNIDFCDICNYCVDLFQTILYSNTYDCIVACYTV